ncbi:MAG: LPP20 family lipoprotein [Candidatus Neomarinimicrobiota bacterium]
MKRTITLMMLGGLLLILAGCAGKMESGTTEARESRDMPAWLLEPPAAEGMIYGVGQAKKQNPSLSKKVAAQRARDEIAAAVKIKVESLVKDFMQESGIGERAGALEFTQAVSKGVTDATLTGAMIKETYIAKDGTYFVLVAYSLDEARRAAIESARQEEALWNEFKAEQGFDALERELEKLQ